MSQTNFSWEIPEKIQVAEMNGTKSVLVEGKTYMNWASGDETAERMAIAQLYKLGLGTLKANIYESVFIFVPGESASVDSLGFGNGLVCLRFMLILILFKRFITFPSVKTC